MKQYEAVIFTLEKLGGRATLAELYREVMKVEDCEWKTKTPFASIRRIVQQREEIFKIRPGLWALESYREKLGVEEIQQDSSKAQVENHSYYQGVIVSLGNLKGFKTFVPQQDKNKAYVDKLLKDIRTLQEIPSFSHEPLVKRSSTIDVVWFNSRMMPNSLFEVEHSTDIQNSLLKFVDLQDFYTRMFIVADANRKAEFEHKRKYRAFSDISNRVQFLSYNSLVKQYENEVENSSQEQIL